MYSNYTLNDFLTVNIEKVSLHFMYKRLNELVFNNELPKTVLIKWNDRTTRVAGCAWHKSKKIEISYKYHSKYPHELLNTVVHEMTHLYYPGESHNEVW